MEFYFCFAAWFLGYGVTGAALSVPGNLVQGAVGLVAGMVLMQIFKRTKLQEQLL